MAQPLGKTEILTALDDDAIAGNCQLHGITVSCFVKILRDCVELWDTSTPLGLMQDLLSLNVNKIPKITTVFIEVHIQKQLQNASNSLRLLTEM